MNIAFWCVLIAGLMPVVTVAIAKWGVRGYDNNEPRAWMEQLQGLRRRADYAHRNHFEAFPFFAAAVIIASHLQAPQGLLDGFALLFIGARIVYTLCYLYDRATLRSIVWSISYLCIVGIFLIPVFKT